MDLLVRAATDVGLRRPQNEDFHGACVPEDPVLRERRGALLLVADGMGGARAGEVASRMAVDLVMAAWTAGSGEPLADLARAFDEANHGVHAAAIADPERRGMGTTLTALVLRGREAFLAHVGDSRVYRLRGGVLRVLTADHSLVAQMVRDGHITPEQARTDWRRNVVTRSVGVGEDVEVDLARVPEPVEAGDTYLLTTDGLHGVAGDEEIAAVAGGADLDAVCAGLVALAHRHGAPDNVTVMAARVTA
jgi:PPM family protein phosphatase